MKKKMNVKTDVPLIQDRSGITRKIGRFWDNISAGWEEVWGPHIHHGYYENGETVSPIEAQTRLIEKLTSLLKISEGAEVLDAGCGIGGSSIYLAENFGVNVSGITLSPVQAGIAEVKAAAAGVKNVSFRIEDALSLGSFGNASFDIVWSLESCEQFYDKALFVNEAKRVMKKDGKLMIATWCSGKDEYHGADALAYRDLCLAFDLPYMPSGEYYRKVLETHGLRIDEMLNWTRYVEKSWDIGISLASAYSFFRIIRKSGFRGLLFTRQLKHMQKGIRNGMVEYIVLVGTKV